MSFDHSTLGSAFARPGMDTRQWVSVGLVEPDAPDAPATRFDVSLGPMVHVALQPSGTVVYARVAMDIAGEGEADFTPFVSGDEVLVAIPEGNENAFPIIVGRLANELDAFPTTVAGVATTGNTVSFRRMRTSRIIETNGGYLIRSSLTGAQIGIDQAGQVVIGGGGGGQLFLSDDAMGFTGGDTALQILPGENKVLARAGSTNLELGESESKFTTGGTLNVGSSGLAGTGHAITLEQLTNILANFMAVAVATGFAGPTFIAAYAINPQTAVTGFLTALLQAAAVPVPFGISGAPGGDLTALGLQPILTAALASQAPDPQAVGAPMFAPGIGRPGLIL
jgi:hypothetical protein